MLATLNQYRAAFSVGLQSNLVYRVNFAVRGFFSFFHLIVVFILWTSAYAGSPAIGGFFFRPTLTPLLPPIRVPLMIGAFNHDCHPPAAKRHELTHPFPFHPVNYFPSHLRLLPVSRPL